MVAARPMAGQAIDSPLTRPLKIFAFDPMRGRDPLTVLSVDVENEDLRPGPRGARVRVVDYDGVNRRYLMPVRPRRPRDPHDRRARAERHRSAVSPADGLRRDHEGARELRSGPRPSDRLQWQAAPLGSARLR